MRTGIEREPREGEGHVETEALPPAASMEGKTDTGIVRGPQCVLYLTLSLSFVIFWPGLLAVEACSLNHWIIREFPYSAL